MFPRFAGCAHKDIASHDTFESVDKSSMVHSFLVEKTAWSWSVNVWPLNHMKSVGGRLPLEATLQNRSGAAAQ